MPAQSSWECMFLLNLSWQSCEKKKDPKRHVGDGNGNVSGLRESWFSHNFKSSLTTLRPLTIHFLSI